MTNLRDHQAPQISEKVKALAVKAMEQAKQAMPGYIERGWRPFGYEGPMPPEPEFPQDQANFLSCLARQIMRDQSDLEGNDLWKQYQDPRFTGTAPAKA